MHKQYINILNLSYIAIGEDYIVMTTDINPKECLC